MQLAVAIRHKIKTDAYQHIDVSVILLQNHNNNGNIALTHNTTNNEIEDFMYPEVMVYLINALLEKKGMVKLNQKTICQKIHTPSFSAKGILELCEFEKNTLNPDSGADVPFVSSGNQTNRVKEGLAGMFNLKGNRKLITLLEECDFKYPYVKQALLALSDFQ